MKKKEHFTPDYTKHYVLQEIGMIKGYKLENRTTRDRRSDNEPDPHWN